jgi:predicted ATP-dependent serine protease
MKAKLVKESLINEQVLYIKKEDHNYYEIMSTLDNKFGIVPDAGPGSAFTNGEVDVIVPTNLINQIEGVLKKYNAKYH